MAVTKLLRIKETRGRNPASHLKKNIFYICNPEKTKEGLYIGGNAGITPEEIFRTMIENKKFWGKEKGTGGKRRTQGFHYILSFPPGETDPETAMRITEEFCRELLGDHYFYVYALHDDTQHLHSHITFDAVSRVDGKIFYSPKGDWAKRLQPITDRLCEKYGLSTLQYDEQKKGKSYQEWKNSSQKRETGDNGKEYSVYDIIRDDVDEAIDASRTYNEFLAYMKNLGYNLRDTKFLSLKPPGRGKGVRSFRLGKGYAKEEIIERIAAKEYIPEMQKRVRTYGDRIYIKRCIICKMNRDLTECWKMSPYQKAFFRKWNNTYFIRKPELHNAVWKYREDILRVHLLAEQLAYMIDHDIIDKASLESRYQKLYEEKKAAEGVLKAIRTRQNLHGTCRLVKKLEELQKELLKFPSGSRPDLEREQKTILEMIGSGKISEAFQEYEELQENSVRYRAVVKSMNDEIKILDRIAAENLNRPDLCFTEYEKQQMEKWQKENTRNYKRITINAKMFYDVDMQKEYLYTRIPFQKECYLVLPADECIMFRNGKTLSAYIYGNQEYEIVDGDKRKIRSISGNEVLKNYEIKKAETKRNKENLKREN